MEVRRLGPGLWRWTAEHPHWDHAENWGPAVGSVYAELPGAVVLVDPLVPDDEEESFWEQLDSDVERTGSHVHVLLTVHWHERSVAAVVERYHAKFWRPEENGDLPPGVHAEVVKGSDWVEAMFFLEPHRALVTGDLLIERNGAIELPITWFPKGEQDWARDELKPDLRKRLGALPIELVLVSHGEPVLEDGAAALDRGLS
jgi:hypothetical protein